MENNEVENNSVETNEPNTTDSEAEATHPVPEPGDPRYAFGFVTAAVGELMRSVDDEQLALATPCDEFTVKELMEHLVLVMRRVEAIGRGDHFSTVNQEAADSGWFDAYRTAAHGVQIAWGDPASLDGMYEVPWGQIPGGPLMGAYAGELAVHGWDLATAVGAEFTVDDALLQPSLDGARMGIPAEIREDPMVPFGPVVAAPEGASVLLQLAGWYGRPVS